MMLFARPPVPRCGLVDTAGLIDDLIAEMKEMFQQREAEIVSHVREGVSFLRVDVSQLMVALRAMCTNSLEAMGHGGRIEISARHFPGGDADQHDESKDALKPTVEISVSDNGPGFSAEQRRHLFDPFYSGREAGRGLGFGLSKCWRIVRNHGGVINVESTPGQGATFRINLPAV
jgi:signal transduction histidine kinase